MPVPSFHITCTKREVIAPNVYELKFSKPEGFNFKAGQFVLFDVPLVENPTDIQTRAYSISSAPHEPELIFVIKLTPGGRASRWIEEILTVGMSVRIQGPFGRFLLDEKTIKGYLLVSTGAGVAPFRSQLKYALEEAGDTRPMQLVFGVRDKKDLFWVDEFMDLMKRFPNFTLHTSLTSGEPDWDGHRGRVYEVMKQVTTDPSQWSVYICGAPQMVNDVKKMCLEDWKMEKKDVHGEGYI